MVAEQDYFNTFWKAAHRSEAEIDPQVFSFFLEAIMFLLPSENDVLDPELAELDNLVVSFLLERGLEPLKESANLQELIQILGPVFPEYVLEQIPRMTLIIKTAEQKAKLEASAKNIARRAYLELLRQEKIGYGSDQRGLKQMYRKVALGDANTVSD